MNNINQVEWATHFSKAKKQISVSWEQDINDLEHFFSTVKLTDQSVRLNGTSTIIDIPKFIETHLLIVKNNNGNPCYLPYMERLQELKKKME